MIRHALGIHKSTWAKLMAITIIAAVSAEPIFGVPRDEADRHSSQAASYVIYQVYFHPLARFSGPFTCKISGTRAIYYGAKGDSHVDILLCHQKYSNYVIQITIEGLGAKLSGPTVRYKPNMLIYNNVSGLKGDVVSARPQRSVGLISGDRYLQFTQERPKDQKLSAY